MISQIKDLSALRHLRVLDISFNKLTNPDKLKEALGNMRKLRIVKFTGNSLCKNS
jgi:Leucine-rich repeat (LRR) protein